MPTDELLEARLRGRLASYGAALEREVADAPPARTAAWPAPSRPLRTLLAAAVVLIVMALAVVAVRAVDGGEDMTTRAGALAGGRWLRPGATPSDGPPPGAAPITSGRAVAVDGLARHDALADALAPAELVSATILGDGITSVAASQGSLTLSVTLQRLTAPVELPVDEESFARGFQELAGGAEMFVGEVDGDTTLAQVVEADGTSTTLSVGAPPDEVADALGDPSALLLAVREAVVGP